MASATHLCLTVEQLYDEASKLESSNRIEADGVVIFTGKHPEHQWVSLIVPAIGDGILLFPPAAL